MSSSETNAEDGVLDVFGVYLQELRTISTLSAEREEELGYVLAEGRRAAGIPCTKVAQAEQELVVSHLPLVVSKAKSYWKKAPQVDIKDLVQAGNMGLLEAARRFDPTKGARFSTYACSWIRKFMVEEYQKAKWLIRMPDHLMRLISWKNKMVNTLFLAQGKEPTFEELTVVVAEERHITLVKAEALIQSIIALEEEVVSLETAIGDEQEARLVDFIVDRRTPSVDQSLEDLLRSDDLQKSLVSLNERERMALELRFGFTFGCGDGWPYTLGDAGREMGVTRERVGHIEAKALRKLRHPLRSSKIKHHLE